MWALACLRSGSWTGVRERRGSEPGPKGQERQTSRAAKSHGRVRQHKARGRHQNGRPCNCPL
eukprot:1102690-Lingulodinium_polyedra.AAC.1